MPATASESRQFRLDRSTAIEGLLLLLILGMAILFRAWRMGEIPPGMDFDEAFESLEAYRVLTEAGYHPIFFAGNNGVPPLKIYLTDLSFLLAGEHTLSIRYGSIVVSLLSVLAIYFLVRVLFPLPAGMTGDVASPNVRPSALVRRYLPLFAAALMAVLPWHLAFSRRGIEVILLPLWAILAVLFLWLGMQRGSFWRFAVSGFMWGSAFYTYQAAWLLIGIPVLWVLYLALWHRDILRRSARHVLAMFAVSGLTLLPLVFYVLNSPATFAHRGTQVTLFTLGRGSETPLRSLVQNVIKVAGVFGIGGEVNPADLPHAQPLLPWLLLVFLVAGIFWAGWRFKQPQQALLLIWFFWMLLPTVITEDAPSIRRAIGSLPAMVILIALGFGWLADVVLKLMRTPAASRPARLGLGMTTALLVLGTAWWSYQAYFVEWGQDKDLFHYFDAGLVAMGSYASSTPDTTRLYYTPAGEGNVVHLPIVWQLRDRQLRAFDGNQGLVLAPPDNRSSLYLVTTFLGDSRTLPALEQAYPAGQIAHQVDNLYGVPHSFAFSVPAGTVPLIDPDNELDVNFGNQMQLLGSSLSDVELSPGAAVTVTLFWRAETAPISDDYTVFTHLIGAPNPDNGDVMWAGQDSPPIDASYPTTAWERGEIIIDRHTLIVPAETPAGSFQIEAGLYAPNAGGSRLKIVDGNGQTSRDSTIVGDIIVKSAGEPADS